jgi:hypothetical protein
MGMRVGGEGRVSTGDAEMEGVSVETEEVEVEEGV